MPSDAVLKAINALASGADVEIVKSEHPPDGAVAVEDVVDALKDQKRVVCFYHSDLDGIVSAAIVRRLHPTAEMIPINYGAPFPWDVVKRASEIWMVDFGLQPFSDMEKLKAECDKVDIRFVWIDHHGSAIDNANNAGFKTDGLRRIGRGDPPYDDPADRDAGCDLTWEYCFPDEPKPRVVQLAGRYDIWDHKDPMVLPVHYAMESAGLKPENSIWTDLFELEDDGFGKMMTAGKTIMRYLDVLHAEHMAGFSFNVEFEGLRCIAANVVQHGSLQFASVAEGFDAALRFAFTPHGHWTCSMYALRKGVNVAEVCERYGGGGHEEAAGFQCEELPFDPTEMDPVADERAEAALKAAEEAHLEIIVKEAVEEKRYTCDLVLEPNDGQNGAPLDPDTQGDIYSAEEIERAQRIYMKKFRRIGRDHKTIFGREEAYLVDCYIVPMESDGLNIRRADGTVRHIRPGTWMQGVEWSEESWVEVKNGTLNAWSIGGKGFRTPL